MRRGVELVFGDARLSAAHRFHDAKAGDLRRTAQHRDLARALDAAHLVEDRIQVAHVRARLPRPQQLDEALLPRDRAVPVVVDAGGLGGYELAAALTEVLGRAELGVNRRRGGAAAAASSGAGWRLADYQRPSRRCHRRQRRDVISPGNALHQLDIVGRDHATLGCFETLVARRQVDRDFLRSPVEKQVSPRRFDSGQVVKGIVLAGKGEAFRLMHALEDGDGIVANVGEDLRVSGAEFVCREIRLVVLRRGQCRREHHHRHHRCRSSHTSHKPPPMSMATV